MPRTRIQLFLLCICFIIVLLGFSNIVLIMKKNNLSNMKTEAVTDDEDFMYGEFPAGFSWGVATSAYQIEGGFDLDGRGPSIWDEFSHTAGKIVDGTNGDVACDSYTRYKEDVALVKQMGVGSYRFSISWSRILPTGKIDQINEKGIDYYNALINELIENNIQPIVTLYHWDLPSRLQAEFGGWISDAIIPLFVDYAKLCFQRFGDRVKTWITLNEPRVVAHGYEEKDMAPGTNMRGTGAYQSSYIMLKAHARVYHTYAKLYKPTQNGRIGITLNCDWGEPQGLNSSNKKAAERFMQWFIGLYAHPIYVGGWPRIMRDLVDFKSQHEGRPKSRLPEFTQAEQDDIIGTSDFLGLNSYTSLLISANHQQTPGFYSDRDIETTFDKSWSSSGSQWLKIAPSGIRKVLKWIKSEYPGYGSILITENGVSEQIDQTQRFDLYDEVRVNYFKDYTNNVLKAIRIDGVNVEGYMAWSLMDNFEWAQGYKERFGLHFVDFKTLKRTPKASALFYKKLVQNNGVPSKSDLDLWIETINEVFNPVNLVR